MRSVLKAGREPMQQHEVHASCLTGGIWPTIRPRWHHVSSKHDICVFDEVHLPFSSKYLGCFLPWCVEKSHKHATSCGCVVTAATEYYDSEQERVVFTASGSSCQGVLLRHG